MVVIRSFKAPARHVAVALLLALIALSIAAVPADAKRWGAPGASITLGADEFQLSPTGCSFEAVYTWSGFSGKGLTASVRLLDASGASVSAAPLVASSGRGTVTFIFIFNGGPGGPSRTLHAHGSLLSQGVELSGSAVDSAPISTTCTGPVSVTWPFTIPLT